MDGPIIPNPPPLLPVALTFSPPPPAWIHQSSGVAIEGRVLAFDTEQRDFWVHYWGNIYRIQPYDLAWSEREAIASGWRLK